MEIMEIFSESPEEEQWKLLLQYSYPSNIKKYLDKKGFTTEDTLIESISGPISQAKEYFDACKITSLQISPLLLYYGVTNLFYGIISMMSGKKQKIENHGMYIPMNKKYNRIADIEIAPNNPKNGALAIFGDSFSRNCDIINSGKWTVMELLALIPELLEDFINHYDDGIPYVIPLEVIKKKEGSLERIKFYYLKKYSSPEEALSKIDGISSSYLPHQLSADKHYIILRPKMGQPDLGIYSISGQKYLKLSYDKNGKRFSPSIEISMYMILYSLSYISRYQPAIWNPFLRNDTSGEKLLIEKFLNLARRIIPNLVLNYLFNKRVMFLRELQRHKDFTSILTKEEVEEIVKQEFTRSQDQERIQLL